jgi:hypothetical protein
VHPLGLERFDVVDYYCTRAFVGAHADPPAVGAMHAGSLTQQAIPRHNRQTKDVELPMLELLESGGASCACRLLCVATQA